MATWKETEKYLKKEIKGFEIREKSKYWHQRLLGKLLFFMDYMNVWTTILHVYKPEGRTNDYRVLQHEGTHSLDELTFFGLFPKKLRYLNIVLFSIAYTFPQCLSLLALLSLGGNLWWLLCLLLLAPLPAPFRMIAEIRAYRRSAELGAQKNHIVEAMSGKTYYWMWIWKKHLMKLLLKKPSPYKNDFDNLN